MARFFLFPVWVLLLMSFFKASSQDLPELNVNLIDSVLLKDANAVVRSDQTMIEVKSVDLMILKRKKIVTILNKYADYFSNGFENYDPTTKIKNQNMVIFDDKGNEIKKYKAGDFNDRSAVDGISLMQDGRIRYVNHTPTQYPYTIIYECEKEYLSTGFIPNWRPFPYYNVSVEESSYNLLFPENNQVRFKKENFEGHQIVFNNENKSLSGTLTNAIAYIAEYSSRDFENLTPRLKVVLEKFSLEGVKGAAVDWKSFGRWQYDHLVHGRDELPEEVIQEVSALVADAKSNVDKARLIYEYVQNKTRYISIQLGIGGWMPFTASQVHEVGYGDCKALTNYTKALLTSQNIKSYYTVLYGDTTIKSIDSTFASMQGNHVILNIPTEDQDIWLECTSQTAPFNFIAGFTDDRDALVITPDGGIIKHTKQYSIDENVKKTKADVYVFADMSIKANVTLSSQGYFYAERYGIEALSLRKKEIFYKKYWGNLSDLKFEAIALSNDKEEIVFSEKVKLSASKYLMKAGSRLLMVPNLFNRSKLNLPNYEDRNSTLEISRGYSEIDEYIVHIPEGFTVKSIPEKKLISTEFGRYTHALEKIDTTSFKFSRKFILYKGSYTSEKYKDYRDFRVSINTMDKSKIVLQKKN